jgi:hypothetical protein
MNLIDQGAHYIRERNTNDQPNTENKKYNKGSELEPLAIVQVGCQEINSCTQQDNQQVITSGNLSKQMFY